MESEIKDIIESAMSLPPNLRASIAEILLESLDFEENFPVSNEWLDEINRRCREIDQGKVRLMAGEEALAQLRKKYS